jgi:DNA-binding response OmpR family regulator
MSSRILVVDDDKSILRSLRRVLERNGYAIDTAETAKEAINKLKSSRYDLAIIDIILPDMKGTDLLAKAKIELQQTIKFIITGYPSAEAGAKAREEGADAFMLKPINMSDLLSVIRVFLSGEENNPYLNKEEEKMTLADVNDDLSS